jgi:hypothetical protein
MPLQLNDTVFDIDVPIDETGNPAVRDERDLLELTG